MPSLDELQRELRAIRQFNVLFLAEPAKRRDDFIAFLIRQAREWELLWALEELAAKN